MPIQIPTKQPRFSHAFFCILVIFALMVTGLFVIKTGLHSIMLLLISWVLLNIYFIDPDPTRLKKNMISSIQKSSSLFLIFMLIGAVIVSFILSGAIPTLIYYGLGLISPTAFLPIGMILCSIMSLVIGTCWGTIGTMGVALIGMASVLNIPLPLAAGMIVSGAYFGDKFSPISDTTILSALSAGTDLYKHIKGMTYSIIPAYLLSLGFFWMIGRHYGDFNFDYLKNVHHIQHLILQHFHVGFLSLIPLLIMCYMSMKKRLAEVSMLTAVLASIVTAVLVQEYSLKVVLDSLFSGPPHQDYGSIILNDIFRRGGILSMMWSMSLTLLILTLGGLLESYHFMSVIFEKMVSRLKTPVSLVCSTLLTSVICNLLMGEAYLSIILTSKIFKNVYEKLGLDNCLLSKSIEEGTTFSTPLIPWTTSGAFVSSTLGVSTLDYLHWSIFNWTAPLCLILLVSMNFVGVKMYTNRQALSVAY